MYPLRRSVTTPGRFIFWERPGGQEAIAFMAERPAVLAMPAVAYAAPLAAALASSVVVRTRAASRSPLATHLQLG